MLTDPQKRYGQAATRPNLSDPYEMSREMYSHEIAKGYNFGNNSPSSVNAYMQKNDANPTEMGQLYRAAEDLRDPGKPWWESLFDKVTPIFETMGIPQQIIHQLVTNGDWREAIPTWLAPDEWAKQGVHHEMLYATDVANVWSDGALDEWYKRDDILSMVGEVGLKTALFAGDIFTDPLSYVPMGVAVKVARKGLTQVAAGTSAEFSSRMALKTGKLVHAKEADDIAESFLEEATKRHAAEQSEDSLRRLEAARKHKLGTHEHLNATEFYNKSVKEGEDLIPKPPLKKDAKQKPLGKEFSEAEKAEAAKAFKGDVDDLRSTVHGIDGEVPLHNAKNLGPDDTANVSDNLALFLAGMPEEELLQRGPRISHFHNQMDITPQGVNPKNVKGVASEIKGKIEKDIARLNAKMAKGEGNADAGRKALERNKVWLESLEKGDIPEELMEWATAKGVLPSGPRFSPIEAADYASSQFGKLAGKVAGVALYPKTIMPMPPGWFNHLVREPTRVLGDASPEMRMRLMDGFKQYTYFQNYTRTETMRILRDAGIAGEGKALKGVKKAFLHGDNLSVDDVKAEELTTLMDLLYAGKPPKAGATAEDIAQYKLQQATAKGKFDEAYAKASPEMQTAHDDMRSLLDAMAVKLEIPNDMYIEGYVPHMRDLGNKFVGENMFKEGRLPPSMEGLSTKHKVFFGNLLERNGSDFDEKNIARIMDVYTRGAAHKAFMEPMMQDLSVMAHKIAAEDDSKRWLLNYTADMLDNIKGKPSSVAKLAEKVAGPNRTKLAKSAAGGMATLGYSAALTGNLRYPVMSMLQALNTTSAKYGPLRTMKAAASMFTSNGRKAVLDAGAHNELTSIYSGISSWATRLKVPGVPSIPNVEYGIRGLTYHAALGDALSAYGKKSLDEITDPDTVNAIIGAAVRETEEANHIFGVIGRPVLFNRVSKTGSMVATQFFSFPFKQTETVLNIAAENPGVFMDYLHIAGKLQQTLAHSFNIDVSDYVGVKFGADIPQIISGERQTIPTQALVNLAKFGMAAPGLATGNIVAVEEAKNALFDSLEMMVPGKTAMGQASQAFAYSAGGKRAGVEGKPWTLDVRKDRRTTLEALTMAAAGKGSFSELKFGEKQYSKGQDGLVSILSGMNTIEGKIERDIGNTMFRRSQELRATQGKLTRTLWDKVRTGDDRPEEIKALVGQLRAMGVDYKDLSQIKDRETKITYAANMDTRLREGKLRSTADRKYAKYLRDKVESRYSR